MSRFMTPHTGGQSSRDRQEADLTRELLAAVDTKLSDMDVKFQQKVEAAVRDIAKMTDKAAETAESAAAEYRERFKALAGDIQSGRARIKDPRACEAMGALVRQMATHRDSPLPQPLDVDNLKAGLTRGGGRQTAGVVSGVGTSGGVLLGEQIIPAILTNLEASSVFERNVQVYNVQSSGGAPRISQGATVFYPDEGVAVTESSFKFAAAKFNPTRYAAFTMIDRWLLSNASNLQLGAFILQELTRAMAYAVDANAFVGDGSATYARVTGVFKRENAAMLTTADAGDNTYQKVADKTTYYLAKVCGAIPEVTEQYEPKWYMHRSLWFAYLGARDSNGKPVADFFAGGDKQLWGYPVETCPVLPKLSDASQTGKVMAAFGAMSRGWAGARFGTGFELRTSEHVAFKEGQIAFVLDAPTDIFELDPGVMALLKTA